MLRVLSDVQTLICMTGEHHTPRCSPSTFNLMCHLCAEGSDGAAINHPAMWSVRVGGGWCGWGGLLNQLDVQSRKINLSLTQLYSHTPTSYPAKKVVLQEMFVLRLEK